MDFWLQMLGGDLLETALWYLKAGWLVGGGGYAYWYYKYGRRLDWVSELEALTQHTHFIGATGVGKTSELIAQALDLISRKERVGLLWIDPHGDSAEDFVARIPEARADDVVWMDPLDEIVVGYNPLKLYDRGYADAEIGLIADNLVSVYEAIYGARNWGMNIEDNIQMATLAVLEYATKTHTPISVFDPYLFMTDPKYFNKVHPHVRNLIVSDYWDTFNWGRDGKGDKELRGAKSKLRKPLASSSLIEMLGQEQGIDLFDAMETGKIVIVKGGKGFGDKNTRLLAGIMVSDLLRVSSRRGRKSPYFFAFLDEFQTYVKSTGDSLERSLTEIRKRNVGLFLAHQGMFQLASRPGILEAVEMTATKYVYRVVSKDAKLAERYIDIKAIDDSKLLKLPDFGAYEIKVRKGFPRSVKRVRTRSLANIPVTGLGEDIKDRSRQRYGVSRERVKDYLRAKFRGDMGMDYDGVTIDVDYTVVGEGDNVNRTRQSNPKVFGDIRLP